MTLQINIDFTPSQLQDFLRTDLSVTIVKGALSGFGPQPVGWIVFRPSPANPRNTIEWVEDYYLYESATATLPQRGRIETTTLIPAPGVVQVFQRGGFNATAQQIGQPGIYGVMNQAGEPRVFGLAQAATVNRRPEQPIPINAAVVPNGGGGFFPSGAEVIVFLSRLRQSGEIISAPPYQPVDLSQNPVANFKFDPSRGFILA